MDAFRFEHIEYLYALLLLLPMFGIFMLFMLWRRRALERLGEKDLLSRLMPAQSRHKHQIKFILLSLAFAALVVAAANPQMGIKYEKVKRKGVDLIIALDVSRSMLAEDVKPNRLERARLFMSRLIDKLQSDRLGIIVFAGHAYLQMPLTLDYSAGKLFLSAVNTDMVPTQGTAISEAISLAMEGFDAGEKKNQALVIISDGEDHEEDVLDIVDEAVEKGITVHTIGIGSQKGAPIPEMRNGVRVDFKHDRQGNIVLSRLDETMLQQIAVKGNGKYFRMSSGTEEIDALFQEIAGMEKVEFEERIFTDYEDQFQYFILLAMFFLALEFFIAERKTQWLRQLNLFGTGNKAATR